MQAVLVEPVHPGERGEFELVGGAERAVDLHALGLVEPDDALGEGIVIAVADRPDRRDRADVREYQLNMDGQQVTQTMGIGGQPLYSRDAIAEFQFISNRFDATQGRSTGVQVNAVTRSGTNAFDGQFSGYFRNAVFIGLYGI